MAEPGDIPMRDPLAFLLTWTTYGTWLPGDRRGWVDKPGKFREPDLRFTESNRARMTETALILNDTQRQIVETTILAHCNIRNCTLHAINCRTNHVHVVVTAPQRAPDDVMNEFKSWCTRKLKQQSQEQTQRPRKPEAPAKGPTDSQPTAPRIRQKWWTQRGSKRLLFDESGLEAAVKYTLDAQ